MYTKYLLTLLALATLSCKKLPSAEDEMIPLAYHFDEPAQNWEETFPLGNGRIGVMPDGGVQRETLVLNEISMWSGSKQNTDNPNAYRSLEQIRKLLFEGLNDQAQQLMYQSFVCKGEGSGQGQAANLPYGCYQMLGRLQLDYDFGELNNAPVADYRRELNLEQAVATVKFTKNDVTYLRETFTSFGNDVAVIRLSNDKNVPMNIFLGLDRPERYKTTVKNNDLLMAGQLTAGIQPPALDTTGVKYVAKVKVVLPSGGKVLPLNDSALQCNNATEILLLVAMNTNFFQKINPEIKADSILNSAQYIPFDTLKQKHVDNYRKLFARVKLNLGRNEVNEKMNIKNRLVNFYQNDNDPSLPELYFQFGRYLLITSTRVGLLPPNLQGLWANSIQTPWNGDYHLNINLQMNLWPAEVTNLSELHLPLIEWTKKQVPSGKQTAKTFYNAKGWVTHILGNVWEFTAPGEHPAWGSTNTSAAWLCQHLYQHFLYTGDTAYLKDVYPTIRDAALFFTDVLVEDPNNHFLVTAPTTSPENGFRLPNGNTANVCAGSTMDNQIIRELFRNTAKAAHLLHVDSTLAEKLAKLEAKLMPTTIAPDGRIMEWLTNYQETEPQHRHVSHLYGLHPADEISLRLTPELANAARKTLEVRGDESTGWSMAWKVNFYARLHDGNHAHKLLHDLLKPCFLPENENKGGTYPNLFCSHPPFQIDGNFGACAGIAEMLVQHQHDVVEFLPALPDQWHTGSFHGLKIKNNATVNAHWSSKKLRYAEITAQNQGTFTVQLPSETKTVVTKINGKTISMRLVNNTLSLHMNPNDVWNIHFNY